MNLLVIADPVIPVPPTKYGGAERIVDLMCRGLRDRGHVVRLLAGPGSQDYGGGLVIHRAASKDYSSRAFRKILFQVLLLRALDGIDVVLNHGRLDYLEMLFQTRVPAAHWFHNPLTGRYERDWVRGRRLDRDRFVAVSRSQASVYPDPAALEVIPNALDLEEIPFSPEASRPGYVLFMGRLTRNKGVKYAIEAARKAGVKLVLAGVVPQEPGARAYFAGEIEPHLGPMCEWVGPYDANMRNVLLAGASALLFPIQWSEPFGLVMIESLAAGVPIIAARRASAPEVVIPGVNGFLCDSVDDMAAAIGRAGTLSRAACRESLRGRFDAPTFIARTEALASDLSRNGA